MSIDMSKFLDTFLEESAEGLDAMESGLLNMQEGVVDKELINTIFRAAHSIKGGGATFGLAAVAQFTHNVETLLDEMRSDKRPVTTGAVDVLLESVDVIRAMLAAAKARKPHDAKRAGAVTARLESQLNSGAAPAAAAAAPAEGAVASGWRIRFAPKPHLFRTGNDPVRMFRELEALGALSVECDAAQLPKFGDVDPEQCHLRWTAILRGEVTKKAVEEIFEWVEGDCELEIAPLESAAAPVAASAAAPVSIEERRLASVETRTSSETASIRVNIDKVDALINMVGELVITQSMLSQVGKDFDMSRLEKLAQGLAQLERNTRELQESVMRIRMMPISFAFQRFPRMVRDLSQKLDKKIELKLSGEQTELDKTVMEKIGDPLVHLVRNSVDHGIEKPDVRRAAGKPETGVVHLNAYHQGGNIVIEITDDGAGLPKDRILKKARERGLVTADAVLTDEQIHDLIFMPGFSTAEQLSDVSGRGVGMDVVRKNIKALGGSVEIRSEAGKGSTFTIRLPLTLAILDGQLVSVGDQVYIVPLVSIVETLQIRKELINAIAGRAELYRLRDEYIPIVRLYDVLGVEPKQRDLANGLLVVVEGDGQRIGMFVDDLQNQQQVVIKSLETNFKRVTGISGATILGDGTVALILDIAGIIHASRTGERVKTGANENSRVRAA
jgi:two-component system chemotaxis sensor kinase CheA